MLCFNISCDCNFLSSSSVESLPFQLKCTLKTISIGLVSCTRAPYLVALGATNVGLTSTYHPGATSHAPPTLWPPGTPTTWQWVQTKPLGGLWGTGATWYPPILPVVATHKPAAVGASPGLFSFVDNLDTSLISGLLLVY